MPEPTETHSLARGAAWVVAGRVTGIVATLAGNILAARLLGPADFGIYLLATSVLAFGAILGMAGLNEAGLRFLAENLAVGRRREAVACLKRMAMIGLVAACSASVLTIAGLAAWQAATGRLQQPVLYGVLIGVGLCVLAWQQLTAEALRAWHKLHWASLFSGGQTGGPLSNLIFVTALVVAIALIGHISAMLAVALLVASVTLTLPLALVALRKTVSETSSVSEIAPHDAIEEHLHESGFRSLLATGGMLLTIQLLAFASQQVDIWIGAATLAPADLGLYGIAKRSMLLSAMPVQMAMLSIVATIPRLHAQKRLKDLERVVRGAATLAAIPSLGALALLVCFPHFILHFVFGEDYAAAAPVILLMALGQVALVLSGNPIHTLVLTGRQRLALVANLISTIVLIAGGILGTRWFGILGLAAASSSSLAIQNGLLWWFARRHVGVWTHVGTVSLPNRTKAVSVTTMEPCHRPTHETTSQPIETEAVAP